MILKWNVPVDNEHHQIGGGQVVHVGCQGEDPRHVQVWTIESSHHTEPLVGPRWVTVVATGQTLPDVATHHGTVLVDAGRIVWHVVGQP